MEAMIQNYQLSHQQVFPYFLGHIQCGKFLSQTVCQRIDFNQGRFFTALPQNIDPDKLLDFEHGGILPSNSNHSQRVDTMDRWCSQFIAEFLNQGPSKVAVIENYMLTPQSPFALIPNVKISPFQEDVYYFLTRRNSTEEIYQALRKSSLVWHFLAVLTQLDSLELRSTESFYPICQNVERVIAGAYDGEGYIVWEKSS